jgi:calcineurin-like phosphoesterase family protein
MEKYNVWFVSDLHIGHKNILYHSPNRIESFNLKDKNDIDEHDKYVINMWLSMTKRGDHIYVLGDFIMTNKKET